MASASVENDAKLGDPLRTVRKWGSRLLIVATIAAIVAILATWPTRSATTLSPMNLLGSTVLAASVPLLLFMGLILPGRATNAFYLRSFRTDPRTWPVRQAIQIGLGPQYRLSGIRDPRRRRSFLDYLAYMVFLLRYSTPKFMNLEAGSDWMQRLWCSLADARCVFIDVCEMTPFLKEEIALAAQAVGLERILFIIDDSQPEASWRKGLAADASVAGAENKIQLARWADDAASREAFIQVVSKFTTDLPAGPAGGHDLPATLANRPADAGGEYLHGRQFLASSVVAAGVATAAAAGLWIAMPTVEQAVEKVILCGLFGLLVWSLIEYLIHVTPRQRLTMGVVLVAGMAWFVGCAWFTFVKAAEGVRRQSQIVSDTNHLREVGLAVIQYVTTYQTLPPGQTGPGGQQQSWQTALLPYLERMDLYESIDRTAAWDAEKNAKAFQTVVEPYQAGGVRPVVDSHGYALSHYAGNALVLGGPRSLRLHDFSNGAATTFLAGEVEDHFRPWADPQNVRDPAVGVKQGPDSFGRQGVGGTLLLMGDGSVRPVSARIDPQVFQALGNPRVERRVELELDVPDDLDER